MPIPQRYFLDADTLSGATTVYLDDKLTICAPDGYYSDGSITRKLVSCVLLPQQVCPSCSIPCGTSAINNASANGMYTISVNMGTSTGAIKIKLNPHSVPFGIKCIFQSVVYNTLSSIFDGYHQSTNPFNYTFIGNSSNDCGISGSIYPALIDYNYDGVSFVNQGTTSLLSVAAGDVSLSSSDPSNTLMVIPKTTTSQLILNISIACPCPSTNFDIVIECPSILPSFSSTLRTDTFAECCLLERTDTYYFASLTDSLYIDIFDYVFSDSSGQYALEDGFYNVDNFGVSQWMEVQNGIVVQFGICE